MTIHQRNPKQKHNWNTSKRVQTPAFRRNREKVRCRDQGMCVRCLVLHDRITLGREVDHFIPQAYGGTDDMLNLWLLCRDCHQSKTGYETATRIGFPPETDWSTGWPFEEPSWSEVIAERQRKWEAGKV